MSNIQKGDLVLVTGATGYIGGHVVEELIAAGYKVRGTSRNQTKADFLVKHIEKKFGPGKLELAEVPDMAADDAYDEAIKGVSGIVHLASIVTFSPVWDEVIPPAIKGVLSIFNAARKEPKVKSLVLTSSSTAALVPVPNQKMVATKDTWNEASVQEARSSPSPYTVYAASKTEAERALWKAVKDTKPSFRVSSVLPNANFGTRLSETGNSTADMLLAAYHGTNKFLFDLPPQYFVNTSDDAKLHVVALTDPECDGERIFAFTAPYNNNDLLAVFRKMEPGRDFGPDVETGRDLSVVPNGRAEELLRKHYGHGFVGLEETIRQNFAPVGSA